MMINIYEGDCLNLLKTFSDKQYAMVMTSPPYNMNLRVRNNRYVSRQITEELTTKYVNENNEIIFSDNMNMDEYFEFHKQVLSELLRVSDYVFYNIQILTGNKPAVFKLMGHFANEIKEMVIWDKVNAEPAIQQGVLNSQYELILILSNLPNEAMKRQFKFANFKRGELKNVWQIKNKKKALNNTNHKATFPVELVEYVLDNFYNRNHFNDRPLLDPFAGIGTVGFVAKQKNIDCDLIELSSDYAGVMKDYLLD